MAVVDGGSRMVWSVVVGGGGGLKPDGSMGPSIDRRQCCVVVSLVLVGGVLGGPCDKDRQKYQQQYK